MKATKILAVILTAALFICSATVFAVAAADENTITISGGKAGHTYTAYQIFDGIYDSTTDELKNIQWGAGFDTTKLADLIASLKAYTWTLDDLDSTATDYNETVAAIRAAINALDPNVPEQCTAAAVAAAVAPLTSAADAEQLADIFALYTKDPGVDATYDATTGNYVWEDVADGYWLIKDKGPNVGTDDVISDYILYVVDDVNVSIKGSVPTVDKKVSTDGGDNYEDGKGTASSSVVNVQIGDILDYEIIGTLPTNYADYSTYKMIFKDTADTALNLISGSVEVYVDVLGDGTLTKVDSGFTATVNDSNPDTLSVEMLNTKALKDANGNIISTTSASKIIVKYQAEVLNTTIADTPDVNSATIVYSNDPNSTGTGETTPDEVKTVTQSFKLVKYDGTTMNLLAGAEFELYKKSVAAANLITLYKESDTVYHVADSAEIAAGTNIVTKITTVSVESAIIIKGLDEDITYKLLETKAPTGYNPLSDPVDVNVNGDTTAAAANITNSVYTITTNVIGIANNSGTTLPETGSFGTAIFIAIGSLLVIGAGVFLVTNKRMKKESI